MSSWKDTVKTYGELRTHCINAGLKEPSDYELKTAQAEITWNIAKQEGFEIGLEQGKAEGMRKVVG